MTRAEGVKTPVRGGKRRGEGARKKKESKPRTGGDAGASAFRRKEGRELTETKKRQRSGLTKKPSRTRTPRKLGAEQGNRSRRLAGKTEELSENARKG